MRAALFAFVLAASPSAGQDASRVSLNVRYLAAPTDWCPAQDGVPMTAKVDGPDIIRGQSNVPRIVKERRGNSVRVVDGANTGSLNRADDFAGPNAEVIGRFSAEFRSCFSPWSTPKATGTWRLSGPNGADLGTGRFENEYISGHWLFFRPVGGSSKAYYAKFGDRLLFAADQPNTAITQSFLGKPDKE